MNTQQERDRMDEARDAGGAQNTEVTRSENRQAVANEEQHPASDNNSAAEDDTRTRGDSDRGHEEGQYDKQTDKPEMNPGQVDQ